MQSTHILNKNNEYARVLNKQHNKLMHNTCGQMRINT